MANREGTRKGKWQRVITRQHEDKDGRVMLSGWKGRALSFQGILIIGPILALLS